MPHNGTFSVNFLMLLCGQFQQLKHNTANTKYRFECNGWEFLFYTAQFPYLCVRETGLLKLECISSKIHSTEYI